MVQTRSSRRTTNVHAISLSVGAPYRRGVNRPNPLRVILGGRGNETPLNTLVGRVARGDEDAFSKLYDELSSLVYGIALRVVRDPSISEEVSQEVFVEVWRSAARFDPAKGNIRSWVSTIAHQRAVDRVRSVEASRRRDNRDADERELVDSSPEVQVEGRIEGQRVRTSLARLSQPQRQAIELAYYDGLTYREVAKVLDIPEGTIKTRIRDGMTRLRSELEVDDD